MSVRPITDVATVKAAGYSGFDTLADADFERLIEAATEAIHSEIAPRFVIAPATDYAEVHEGDLAVGRCRDYLYLKHWPIITVTSIKENGVVLTFGTGYDAAANKQVIVEYEHGILRRVGGGGWPAGALVASQGGFYRSGWSPGMSNIEIAYRGGWEDGAAPADMVQWCIEKVVRMKREPTAAGITSVTRASASQTIDHEQSPMAARARQKYSPHGRPRTYTG